MRLKSSDNVVVITTMNGKKYLHSTLNLINTLTPNQNVIVVDSGSTDDNFITDTDKLCNEYKFTYIKSKHRMFDFTSVRQILDMDTFDFQSIFFQHDNLMPRFENSYDVVFKNISKGVPFVWCGFDGNSVGFFDNIEQREWCKSICEDYMYQTGVFGPIFGIQYDDLKSIKELYSLNIDNKNKQRATERVWSILFNRYKMKPVFYSTVFNVDIAVDKLPLFIKHFERRNDE
jgi:glycosyltransferase involved in cell wall biosynthesis